MRVCVINGASGTGKSTVLEALRKKANSNLRIATIEGDDLAFVTPNDHGSWWAQLVRRNLAACARNMREQADKIDLLFIVFPFPERDSVGEMTRLLKAEGLDPSWVNLYLEEECLRCRLGTRKGWDTDRVSNVAVPQNKKIQDLDTLASLDASHKSPEELAAEILSRLEIKQ